jgi:PilZ domain
MLAMSGLQDLLASDDVMGVLTRESRVRLVNISASGCLLESGLRMEPGTSGELRLTVDGETYCDAIRVSRVQQMYGAGAAWHVGAEFLWTTRPGSRSLRRMVSRLRRQIAQQSLEVELISSRPM